MKKTIIAKITPKEYQLLYFIRNKFKFGKCELVVHTGEPQKIELKRRKSEVIFDGVVQESVDK